MLLSLKICLMLRVFICFNILNVKNKKAAQLLHANVRNSIKQFQWVNCVWTYVISNDRAWAMRVLTIRRPRRDWTYHAKCTRLYVFDELNKTERAAALYYNVSKALAVWVAGGSCMLYYPHWRSAYGIGLLLLLSIYFLLPLHRR